MPYSRIDVIRHLQSVMGEIWYVAVEVPKLTFAQAWVTPPALGGKVVDISI